VPIMVAQLHQPILDEVADSVQSPLHFAWRLGLSHRHQPCKPQNQTDSHRHTKKDYTRFRQNFLTRNAGST
jgi:hypothetical protein